MSQRESPGAIVKWASIAVLVTAAAVVGIQLGARLIMGKSIGGMAVAMGVPLSFLAVRTIRSLRRRRSD